jgi:DNA (cytosine-5)-methyltransferase 1
MLNGLDLFSGIGGLTIALAGIVRPIVYCENDRYAQAVLLSRMADKSIPLAPIWDDVRTLGADQMPGSVDIIYGGFPCQDISVAGNGVGLGGERSGLFQHIARLVSETNPRFVFLENVPAIRTRGLNSVAQTFIELGYDCRWTIVSAQEIGAPHIRKRWFFLAHANRFGLRKEQRAQYGQCKASLQLNNNSQTQSLANTERIGSQEPRRTEIGPANSATDTGWWEVEPAVGRVADGIQNRVDRLRGLGNAVVPLQAREAFKRLTGINQSTT